MPRHTKTAIGAALLCAISAGAHAQAFIELDTVPTVLGLGIGAVPDYRGSDDYTGAIAPYFRYSFSGTERYLQLNATELTLNLVNDRGVRFGPVLNYHFGRDDDVHDKAVKRMAKIDDSVEAGVFGELVWAESGNPRNRFILGLTLLADVSGESDGFRARLNGRYWHQVSRAVDVHVGGGLTYADGNYTNHYFGVTRSNVRSSGLPLYDADSGLNEYYATLGAVVYFSRNWIGMAGVRLSQLAGDAKDSPIVSQRGDKFQFIGGIGLGYMWR
jgi:outer membrane protein